MRKSKNRYLKKGTLLLLTASMALAPTSAYASQSDNLISHLGSYSTGYSDQEGGVAEIVSYNKDNKKFYLVNGKEQTLDIVSIAHITQNKSDQKLTLDTRVEVGAMAEEHIPGFSFGDITSVSVDTVNNRIAAAIQESDYSKNGAILLIDYDGNYLGYFEAGVQPDNVVFSSNGKYLLSANEGEPRMGYENDAIDPKGSVTIVNFSDNEPSVNTVTFDAWDSKREELTGKHVLLKKGVAPSTDFEPEYIVISSDQKAYVALQEANAIATLDLKKGTFTAINSLGFKDHSNEGNKIDVVKDKKVNIKTENLMGTYMPDGISIYENNGHTYLLTANEGDASEWEEYANLKTIEIDGEEVEVLDPEKVDGFPSVDEGTSFLLGGRSFSIYEITNTGLKQVFDSGCDFETITAEKYEDYFNASNKNNKKDSRSDAKGPEPESVVTVKADNKTYACIGLERIGGVMVYDITNPSKAAFCDYINTRDFTVDFPDVGTAPEQGDISVEGLCAIAASDSPTGYPMLLAANEVSGTVAVFGINKGQVKVTVDHDEKDNDDASYENSSIQTGWKRTGNDQWYYIQKNGSKIMKDWANIDGLWYHFSDSGMMETGWILDHGTWYYLHKDGSMAYSTWLFSGQEWYYVSENGSMLTNTMTPDGYSVNESGCWIP